MTKEKQIKNMEKLGKTTLEFIRKNPSPLTFAASNEQFDSKDFWEYLVRKGKNWKDFAKICRARISEIKKSKEV